MGLRELLDKPSRCAETSASRIVLTPFPAHYLADFGYHSIVPEQGHEYTVHKYSIPIIKRQNLPMNASLTTTLIQPFRPIDELEDSLLKSWIAVSQATHRFLHLLREFDLRQGWKAYGNTDCAESINWRCGICRNTAQEKVRVARALWVLPRVDEAFEGGELSNSKVRALTRVAGGRNEQELLDYALGATASQVEAYCRRLRNGDVELSSKDAKRLQDARSLTRQFREDGPALLTVELPREDLELVLKALE